MSEGRKFENEQDALEFILSGKATFTVVSKRTGKRFTFKVERPGKTLKANDDGFRFAKLMTGADNVSNYTYIGTIRNGYFKSKPGMTDDNGGVAALSWVMKALKDSKNVLDQAEIWHEGRCGACGKKLTVPASIESGYGPECVKSRFVCS